MIRMLILDEIIGSLLVNFAIDGGIRIELLHLFNLTSVEEEIIVLFQKLEYLITDEYQTSIYSISMHSICEVETFLFNSTEFFIQFIFSLFTEHACSHFFYIMFFIFFICDYKRTEKCSNLLYYKCGTDVVIFIAHIYDIKFSNKLVFKIIIFISKIMSDRVISSCAHKFSLSSCKKCGVYDFGADSAIKTNIYDSYLNCSAAKYLHHMRKRSSKPIENKDIMESTFGLLQSICEKFQYTLETLALGLYVYAKSCKNQEKDEKFWASAALIVASKGIELDKRVPYLNRYQRYADKSFTQEDYQLAEKTILQELDFDIQYTTFVSFLHFYMTNGVLFKSDAVNPSIVKYIQDDMISRAKDFIRTGEFLSYQPEKLALSIIKDIRGKFRMDPWKRQLQILSGVSQDDVECLEKINNILKPLNNFQPKHNTKSHLLSTLNPLSMNTLQTSLTLTQQKLKQSKKKLQSTLKFHNTSTNPSISINSQNLQNNHIKQNSTTKIIQEVVPLTTLRNQVISSNKYGTSYNTSSSTDRIITMNSFVTRRF